MSSAYDETRDNEQLLVLKNATDDFIARFQNPPPTNSTCPRQTVFLFPGGMASQLMRATQGFQDGLTVPQTFNYLVTWLTFDAVVFGATRDLKMHRDAAGTFRDRSDRIIIADGLITNLVYEDFIAWCASNNLDLFVFNYDWRRRAEETASFFVHKFLPFFRARVLAAGLPDPLANFSMVGHSFGGMIVNLVLRWNDPSVATLDRAITVATPFYGYAGQVHRWFEGEPYFNGTLDMFKQDLMETIASWPGVYPLHFLDEVTYHDSTNQSGLTADTGFPLTAYPSMDTTNVTLRADPYNPQTNGPLVRYPAMTGFDLAELDYARLQFQQLAAPMNANLLQKFYNIRGVCTQNDQMTPTSNTPGSVTWAWIPTGFNSTSVSPIVDGGNVPGDDTQPAWTARLVTNAPARCITVKASNLSHMFMMNHPQILAALESILCAPGAAMNSPGPMQEPASDQDVVEFVRWLRTQRKRKTPWPRFDDPALVEVVPLEFKGKLPAIVRRMVMDIMKRPAPPGLTQPAKRPRPKPRPRKKPAGKPDARKPASRRRR